jgi:hypothetical protein
MSNQDDLTNLIKAISGQANILTIPRVYVAFTKSHRSALFLSQCVYWSDRTSNSEGWFYKSFRQWKDELGLNQHAVVTCVKTLTQGGWLETKLDKVGIRDTTFYRPIFNKISESIQSTLAETSNVETAKVRKRKTITSTIKQRLPTKTTKERAAKPRDPLLDHPAVVTYREIMHLTPNTVQRQALAERVGDNGRIDSFKAHLQAWALHGWSPRNVDGILESFEAGGIKERNGAKPNGNGHEQTAQRPYTAAELAAAEQINARAAQRAREAARGRG